MKKKILLLLLICCFVQSAYAVRLTKEQKIDKKIDKACGCYFDYAEKSGNPDDEIYALQCLYKKNQKYKRNNAKVVGNIHDIYAEKYEKSLKNKKYFKQMHKYSMKAIKENTKDIDLIKRAFYYSWSLGKKKDMDKAFEYLAFKNETETIELRKFLAQKDKEARAEFLKKKQEAEKAEKERLKALLNGPVYDEESKTYYTRQQKWQLDLNRSKTNRTSTNIHNNVSSGSFSRSDSESNSSSSSSSLNRWW